MEYRSPAYHVIAVPVEKVVPNSYNPNTVAPPEMKLLYESIKNDGYTMPVVCYYKKTDDRYVIVEVSSSTDELRPSMYPYVTLNSLSFVSTSQVLEL